MNNNIINIGTTLKWRGVYNPNTTYYKENLVTYSGCVFRCKAARTTNTPPAVLTDEFGHLEYSNSEIWDVLVDGSLYANIAADQFRLPKTMLNDINGLKEIYEKLPDNLWKIVPNSSVISIRGRAIYPDNIYCSVLSQGNKGITQFDDNNSLVNAGVKLYFSLNNIDWSVFETGRYEELTSESGEAFQVETNLGYELETGEPIHAETSKEPELILGGAIIPVSYLKSNLYLALVETKTNIVLDKITIPVIKDGQSAPYSIRLYKRNESKPAPPSGGTYSNPTNSITDWSKIIPSGELQLWVTERMFYDIPDVIKTAEEKANERWHDPVMLADLEEHEILFSSSKEKPNTPSDDKSQRLAQGWMKPEAINESTLLEWRAERIFGNGAWGKWVVTRMTEEIVGAQKYGEWLISQRGIQLSDDGGIENNSLEYGGFEMGEFRPYIGLNFTTGECIFAGNVDTYLFDTHPDYTSPSTYVVSDYLNLMSRNNGNVVREIQLPSGAAYIGRRVTICETTAAYTQTEEFLTIKTDPTQDQIILGFPENTSTLPIVEGAQRSVVDILSGSIELLGIPHRMDNTLCDWMILSVNAKYLK